MAKVKPLQIRMDEVRSDAVVEALLWMRDMVARPDKRMRRSLGGDGVYGPHCARGWALEAIDRFELNGEERALLHRTLDEQAEARNVHNYQGGSPLITFNDSFAEDAAAVADLFDDTAAQIKAMAP